MLFDQAVQPTDDVVANSRLPKYMQSQVAAAAPDDDALGSSMVTLTAKTTARVSGRLRLTYRVARNSARLM